MNPIDILREFYAPGSSLFNMLWTHSRAVADKALSVAAGLKALSPDFTFIEEAALLHDIGIFMTQAPKLGCNGHHPYVCHGILGRALLEEKGLFRHALVCERHVGVGITLEDIHQEKLPLPPRDMRPVTLEEEIICYADKFFSKSKGHTEKEKTLTEIVSELAPYGRDKTERFLTWCDRFGNPPAMERVN